MPPLCIHFLPFCPAASYRLDHPLLHATLTTLQYALANTLASRGNRYALASAGWWSTLVTALVTASMMLTPSVRVVCGCGRSDAVEFCSLLNRWADIVLGHDAMSSSPPNCFIAKTGETFELHHTECKNTSKIQVRHCRSQLVHCTCIQWCTYRRQPALHNMCAQGIALDCRSCP